MKVCAKKQQVVSLCTAESELIVRRGQNRVECWGTESVAKDLGG